MSIQQVETISERIVTQGKGVVDTQGRHETGFKDNTNTDPITEIEGSNPSINGGGTLNTFGADTKDLSHGNLYEYSKTYTYASNPIEPHILEFNDTTGSERILLKHGTHETGINLGPDGSVLITSKGRVDVSNGDYTISVSGDCLLYTSDAADE